MKDSARTALLCTVPHALVPVYISLEHDFGVYAEPGVWVDHRL